MPKQHEQPQTRVLRKRERQGNVDIERHEAVEGVDIRPEAANMEGKQREGRVKQVPKRPEQPEPPQAEHSRVLRKRERR